MILLRVEETDMASDLGQGIRTKARLVRILLLINFAVLLALLGPGRSHELDVALRRMELENLIGRFIQVWLVGSTLLASALFVVIVWTRRKTEPAGTLPQIKFEAVLLLAWSVILLGLMAYGFMFGMGG